MAIPKVVPPSPDEFDSAVVALRRAFGDRATVMGHWTASTVEIRGRGQIRTHLMLTSESAAAFCQRVCAVESDCDADVLHQQLAKR
jgi:hypothetical protein